MPDEVDDDLKLAVARLARAKWDHLLLALKQDDKKIIEYQELSKNNFVRASTVVNDWKDQCGKEASVRALVIACDEIGICKDVIVKEYKRRRLLSA